MEIVEKPSEQTAEEWWNAKRKKYNLGLVKAGILAFMCFVFVGTNFIMPFDSEFEITLFTTFFQGIGYLIMMGIANQFYNIGYWADATFNKKNSLKFRTRLFNTGYWFSFCFPFLIPLLLFLQYLIVFKK